MLFRSAPTGPLAEDAAIVDPTAPLTLTVDEAVLIALQHNQALVVEKLNAPIARTFIEQQRAIFDPILRADLTGARQRIGPDRTGAVADSRATRFGGGVSVGQYFPTGTNVTLDATSDAFWRTPQADFHESRTGLTVSQALLRNFGVNVNLAGIRQARLDVLRSEYELRGFTEQLVAEVERTYWRTVLAQQQIRIFEDSLRLAEQQLNEANERIEVGRLAETELAARDRKSVV